MMNRRNFLKLVGLAPLLAAMPKSHAAASDGELTEAMLLDAINTMSAGGSAWAPAKRISDGQLAAKVIEAHKRLSRLRETSEIRLWEIEQFLRPPLAVGPEYLVDDWALRKLNIALS